MFFFKISLNIGNWARHETKVGEVHDANTHSIEEITVERPKQKWESWVIGKTNTKKPKGKDRELKLEDLVVEN